MADDTVFQLVVDFLESENGNEVLPDRVTNKFIAACIRQTHKDNKIVSDLAISNDKRIVKLEEWQTWLKAGAFTSGAVAAAAIILEIMSRTP